MDFTVHPIRFIFRAREEVRFPAGKPANILRGACGQILRRLSCKAGCSDTAACAHSQECTYGRLFEPSAPGSGPSGLEDVPRPFVFRAAHLDAKTVAAGESFYFGMNLFVMTDRIRADLERTFAEMGREGLGAGRGQAELKETSFLEEPLVLDLEPSGERVEWVQVRFVTPTELKAADKLAEKPEFRILAARIRDRLSTLRMLYQGGPLETDFHAFGVRAAEVRLTRCELNRTEARRRSIRTGQMHSLGGFTGVAEYEGKLTEFLPYLRAAQFTGVGRQTVWGKGELQVSAEMR